MGAANKAVQGKGASDKAVRDKVVSNRTINDKIKIMEIRDRTARITTMVIRTADRVAKEVFN